MTESEARKRKVGARVCWTDPDVGGEVLVVGINYIGIGYDDGEEGHLHPADCARLARTEEGK